MKKHRSAPRPSGATKPRAPSKAPAPAKPTAPRPPAKNRTAQNFDATFNERFDALPATRYHFFGGKGGVGKTTAAAAAALALLDRAAPGEQILLFSTDPAHSLSDSLGIDIGDRLVEAAGRGRGHGRARLFAREMDAARALAEFKTRHRAVLAEIANRGTLLDEQDVDELLNLSLPGLDEVMSLFELSEVERAGTYARIVVDTAPSGHTSRMLRLPDVFERWVHALDLMSEKHRYLVAQFARGRRVRVDEVDAFLRDTSARIRSVREMLCDPARTSFTLVTIPEALAVEESARYFQMLRERGVPVTDLVINRIEREHDHCPFCRARARGQRRWTNELAREFASLKLCRVPLFAEEVCGPDALRRFARLAWSHAPERDEREETAEIKETEETRGRAERSALPVERDESVALERGDSFALAARRLLIFGGKGGVGKTTAAAAAALALARKDAAARVLVISTDPAHSLSDSFDEEIGELRRGVAGVANLDAMEINPAARFEELKERYRAWADELFESLTGGSRWEVQFDREAMREMVALAPPGIDEVIALSVVSELVDDGSYTTIVIDTAPTGHLLRFLELPDVALSWVRTFMKLLLKYKNVIRWGSVAEQVLTLSKEIKRVAAQLVHASECEFVGVAIPERMSLAETARLAESLARLRVPMSRLLINNVVPAEAAAGCRFCAARTRSQARTLAEFRRRFARASRLYVAPQQRHEIRGRKRLIEHFQDWQLLTKRARRG